MKDEHKKRKKEDEDYHFNKHKKSEGSSHGSHKSSKLAHYPMSERQQYALLKQMDDDHSVSINARETSETSSNISGHSNDSPSYSSERKINKRNGAGETLLIQMAKKGDFNAIKCLIQDGANVNEQDYAGWTALHESSIRNYLPIAQYLLQHDADVNLAGLHGDTALHDAVRNNCGDVVRLLIRYGADSRKRNDKGIRPLDLAQTDEMKKILLCNSHSNEMVSSSSKDKRSKYSNKEATSSAEVTPNKYDNTTKDPYAFEDEELDNCKLPNTPTKTGNKSKMVSTAKSSTDEQSSLFKFGSGSSPSNSSSPKVPTLRIKIGGDVHSENEDAEEDVSVKSQNKKPQSTNKSLKKTDEDSVELSKKTTIQNNLSSDSEASIVSQEANAPDVIIKKEMIFKYEEKEATDDKFMVKEECSIKEDRKSINSSSPPPLQEAGAVPVGKKSVGRTLRSHTNAASSSSSVKECKSENRSTNIHKDNEKGAPIKKRKFRRHYDKSNKHEDGSGGRSAHEIHTNESSSSTGEPESNHPGSSSVVGDLSHTETLPDQSLLINTSTGETWSNPYKRAILIQSQLDSLFFSNELVHPKPPVGYKDFLLNCHNQYLLGNKSGTALINSSTTSISKRGPPSDITRIELIKLFEEQELLRYQQALKHQSEREHLRITAEQEVIRAHSKAARQLAGHDSPYSFCSVVAYKNFTYLPNCSAQLQSQLLTNLNSAMNSTNKSSNKSSANNEPQKLDKFSSDEFIKLLKLVKVKYDNEKRNILNRQLHESESLMMVQKMNWEIKLRDLQLEDIHGDPSLRQMNADHVPMIEVPQDFLLFATDPFQLPVGGTNITTVNVCGNTGIATA